MSVAQSLIPDEAVEFSSKKHWIAPVRDSAVPILLMVGAYLIGRVSPDSESGVVGTIGNVLDLVRVGLMVIAIGWIGVNIIVWRTAEFVVTNLRVVREEGFVSRRSSATLLTSVSDVKSKVGFLGKALGYGDLAIFTQSGEAGADRFHAITAPEALRDAILARKMAAGGVSGEKGSTGAARSVTAAALPGSTISAADSADAVGRLADALARLADLEDRGAITHEEYDAKKLEILARM